MMKGSRRAFTDAVLRERAVLRDHSRRVRLEREFLERQRLAREDRWRKELLEWLGLRSMNGTAAKPFPVLVSDLEERILAVLLADDGAGLLTRHDIAQRIQSRFGVPVVDESSIGRALKRMQERGWPIERHARGSRIPPSQRDGMLFS